MKYAPYIAIAAATGLAVITGLYFTNDPVCLWGLFVLWPTAWCAHEVAKSEK